MQIKYTIFFHSLNTQDGTESRVSKQGLRGLDIHPTDEEMEQIVKKHRVPSNEQFLYATVEKRYYK
ncbi:hypothetical protein CEW46_31430 [Bacillus cereus]|nr:hypothetical protein CEW46_31430 [Bacillus cereus]